MANCSKNNKMFLLDSKVMYVNLMLFAFIIVPISMIKAAMAGVYHENLETAYKFNIQVTPITKVEEIDVVGEPVILLNWTDKTGKNHLVLTQTGAFMRASDAEDEKSAELFAYHYRIEKERPVIVRKIYDFEKACPFDIYVGFLEDSLTITDLDEDNIAEVTMIYKLTCRSDVSPSRMKLIMLEDGNKYALRGQMTNEYVESLPEEERQRYAGEYGWGKYTIDKAFTYGPNRFLEYSIKRWQEMKGEDQFEQMNLQ